MEKNDYRKGFRVKEMYIMSIERGEIHEIK